MSFCRLLASARWVADRSRPSASTGQIGLDPGPDDLLFPSACCHSIIRRSSSFNTGRLHHLYGHKDFQLHYGDLT